MRDSVVKAIEMIKGTVPEERVLIDEPMHRHTSFRIGGPAAALVLVSDEAELSADSRDRVSFYNHPCRVHVLCDPCRTGKDQEDK